jgi:hypothetical protein
MVFVANGEHVNQSFAFKNSVMQAYFSNFVSAVLPFKVLWDAAAERMIVH